jgi:hypothetical protein
VKNEFVPPLVKNEFVPPLEKGGQGGVESRGLELVFQHTGPLPELLRWLAELPVADLRIEPMGLANIYQHYHQISE